MEVVSRNIENIKSTAHEARTAFEQGGVSAPLLKELYADAHPDAQDVDRYVDFLLERFPKANCDLATLYLKHVMGEGDVVEGGYELESHYFLAIGRIVVDITADQFEGGEAVYVGPLVPPRNDGSI